MSVCDITVKQSENFLTRISLSLRKMHTLYNRYLFYVLSRDNDSLFIHVFRLRLQVNEDNWRWHISTCVNMPASSRHNINYSLHSNLQVKRSPWPNWNALYRVFS